MGWSLRENMYQVIDKIKLMRSNLSILIKESIGARSQNNLYCHSARVTESIRRGIRVKITPL